MVYKVARTLMIDEAAYLAGLNDGEGTITLSRRHANEKRQLVVSISSTEPDLVEWEAALQREVFERTLLTTTAGRRSRRSAV